MQRYQASLVPSIHIGTLTQQVLGNFEIVVASCKSGMLTTTYWQQCTNQPSARAWNFCLARRDS